MAVQPLPSTFSAVLTSIGLRLTLSTGLNPAFVKLTPPEKLDLSPPHPDGFVWYWAQNSVLDEPRFHGAGRVDTRFNVKLEVGVRTRLATDEVTVAVDWMTDSTLGHSLLLMAAINALAGWTPNDDPGANDATGNWLGTQPIKPDGASRSKLFVRGEQGQELDWGETVTPFSLAFQLQLGNPFTT